MKAKKEKKWYETTRFEARVRYDPKWDYQIKKKFKGRSMAERVDKLFEEFFKTKI